MTKVEITYISAPPLEVKITPGQKAIHHFTPTSNLQNKKL
jgi:hypothetical protein